MKSIRFDAPSNQGNNQKERLFHHELNNPHQLSDILYQIYQIDYSYLNGNEGCWKREYNQLQLEYPYQYQCLQYQ